MSAKLLRYMRDLVISFLFFVAYVQHGFLCFSGGCWGWDILILGLTRVIFLSFLLFSKAFCHVSFLH